MQGILNRRKFLETIAMVSSGLIAGAARAAPDPMWVPVPVPAQGPVQEGMVEVDGSRL